MLVERRVSRLIVHNMTTLPIVGSYEASTVQIAAAMPIFHIVSVEKATEYDRDCIGFTVDWGHRFDDGAPRYHAEYRDTVRITRRGLSIVQGSTGFLPRKSIETPHIEDWKSREIPCIFNGVSNQRKEVIQCPVISEPIL